MKNTCYTPADIAATLQAIALMEEARTLVVKAHGVGTVSSVLWSAIGILEKDLRVTLTGNYALRRGER